MRLCSVLSRDWKTTVQTVGYTVCLLSAIFIFVNNAWTEIRIEPGSRWDWIAESTHPNPEPLRLDEYEKFTATAFRTNQHDFRLVPGVEKDPEFGYIEFSASGNPQSPLFSDPKREYDSNGDAPFTHSIKYKWETPGSHTVIARVFDEEGVQHDAIEWRVRVDEVAFERLPDLPPIPSIPDPPTLQVYPEVLEAHSYYTKRVGDEMTFRVRATSDDGIASIAFLIEDSNGSRQLINKKEDFLFPKKILAYWPSFEEKRTWDTSGGYQMIVRVTTKTGGFREVAWRIKVQDSNLPPIRLNAGSLTDLGSLTIGGELGMVYVSEHFSDPEGDPLTFTAVGVNAATPNTITLSMLADSNGYKSIIAIEPKRPGRAICYAIARERDGLTAMQCFTVLVEHEDARVPVVVGTVPTQKLTDNKSSPLLDVPSYSDLVIKSIHVDRATLNPCETFQIEIRVWNQGKAAASATKLRYYLSADETISPEDTEVASDRVDSLYGKGATASRRRADMSETFTAPDTPGIYYYGVCVDAVAGEADTRNNCSQAIAITVEPEETEPIVRPEDPDLLIRWARVDASTIQLGGGVRLHITLENRGKRAAPATMIRYYRSLDATISPEEDTEIRAVPVGGLRAGKRYTTWALLPSATSLGVYYFGACLDGVASEFDTSNNCSDAFEITIVRQGSGKDVLVPSGTISTQALEVGGSPVVLGVSGNFVGQVERYTASSSNTSVLKVSMSGSEVTLTAVSEGWSVVTIEASRGDLTARQTFSASVGEAGAPEPTVPITLRPDFSVTPGSNTDDTTDPEPPVTPDPVISPPIDTSPEVSIPDANLRAAVRSALGLTEGDTLTQQKMMRLTTLNATSKQISDLTGLAYATNLWKVDLQSNQISDLSPVKDLTRLTVLHLQRNQISDITSLTDLTNLTDLRLQVNQISDITALQNLTNLKDLHVWENQISDLTPLQNLTSLKSLVLSHNQISDLTPLQNMPALWNLNLSSNQISDVLPLQNLSTLTILFLGTNQISDLTPLQNLSSVQILTLYTNKISNVTPLANLNTLNHLQLESNKISDVSPLENLTALTRLSLEGNPIVDLTPLQRLKANNPSVNIDIDINAGQAPSTPVLPDETLLLSNYPNPFNPETWIPYQLAESTDVTVTIYDVRGVVVRRLALGHQPTGFYRGRGRAAHWDGRNALGEKVATGLYFYTLTAGDFTATQKMLIRK